MFCVALNFTFWFFQPLVFRAKVSSKVEIRLDRFPRRETLRKFVLILHQIFLYLIFVALFRLSLNFILTQKRFT